MNTGDVRFYIIVCLLWQICSLHLFQVDRLTISQLIYCLFRFYYTCSKTRLTENVFH